jgi:hypothetical protein
VKYIKYYYYKQLGRAGYVVYADSYGEMSNAYTVLVRKTYGRLSLGRHNIDGRRKFKWVLLTTSHSSTGSRY